LETDNETYSPRAPLIVLGVVSIFVLVGIGASLAVPLQPTLGSGSACATAGAACVFMPPNAALIGFSPKNIIVVVGVNNTVVWTNKDSVIHTVYSRSVPVGVSPFHSSELSTGDTFKITLNITGVYDYFCSIHPGTMTGSITVLGRPTSS
jgi:plastocyanin